MMWAAISLEKMALLPVERVFPEHHSLDIQPDEGCFPGIEAGNCVMGAGLLITETGRSGCDGGVYEG